MGNEYNNIIIVTMSIVTINANCTVTSDECLYYNFVHATLSLPCWIANVGPSSRERIQLHNYIPFGGKQLYQFEGRMCINYFFDNYSWCLSGAAYMMTSCVIKANNQCPIICFRDKAIGPPHPTTIYHWCIRSKSGVVFDKTLQRMYVVNINLV